MSAPCCNRRASNRTQFGESMRSSKVSSMATIRWLSGMRAMSALSSVVLPLAVPPLRRILRQVCNTRSASSRMCAGSAPCETSCAAEKDGVPKRRTQMATRDPSPNRASRMGRGKRAGPRPGARDTDAADNQERVDESVKHRAARRCPSLRSRLEPQPRGAVTRRAVAQRRNRASGLTRPLAEAIRGFDSGFGVDFVGGSLARPAAVWCKSFVFSLLPIRKVLVLPFAWGVSPPLPVVSLLFSVSYPQVTSLLLLVL